MSICLHVAGLYWFRLPEAKVIVPPPPQRILIKRIVPPPALLQKDIPEPVALEQTSISSQAVAKQNSPESVSIEPVRGVIRPSDPLEPRPMTKDPAPASRESAKTPFPAQPRRMRPQTEAENISPSPSPAIPVSIRPAQRRNSMTSSPEMAHVASAALSIVPRKPGSGTETLARSSTPRVQAHDTRAFSGQQETIHFSPISNDTFSGRSKSARPSPSVMGRRGTRSFQPASGYEALPSTALGLTGPGEYSPAPPVVTQRAKPVPGSLVSAQVADLPSSFLGYGGEHLSENPNPGGNLQAELVPLGAQGEGYDLGAIRRGFHSKVWNRIANARHYPLAARKRGYEGNPVVGFTLEPDGSLKDIVLVESSHHELLDEAALDAVKMGSPYPPIPDPLGLKSIRFQLPISFILEKP